MHRYMIQSINIPVEERELKEHWWSEGRQALYFKVAGCWPIHSYINSINSYIFTYALMPFFLFFFFFSPFKKMKNPSRKWVGHICCSRWDQSIINGLFILNTYIYFCRSSRNEIIKPPMPEWDKTFCVDMIVIVLNHQVYI